MKTAKKYFEDLVSHTWQSFVLDELQSKILGILYSEPKQLTLKELSIKTNYSFSAISAAMKMLTTLRVIRQTKKGGSKKLYFSVQRDMLTIILEGTIKKNEIMVKPAIEKIPGIIDKCKRSKTEDSKEMIKILEQYYQDMEILDKIMKQLVEITKKVQKEVHKK